MIIDIVGRYFFIKPLSPPFIADAYIHHRLKPDTLSVFKNDDFYYIQRVNNIILHGRNIDLMKQSKLTVF
jgi:hypothetical protein